MVTKKLFQVPHNSEILVVNHDNQLSTTVYTPCIHLQHHNDTNTRLLAALATSVYASGCVLSRDWTGDGK